MDFACIIIGLTANYSWKNQLNYIWKIKTSIFLFAFVGQTINGQIHGSQMILRS